MAQAPGPNEMRDPRVRQEVQRAAIWIGMVVAVVLVWFLAHPILLIIAGLVFGALLDGGTRLIGKVLPIPRGFRLTMVVLAAVGFVYWLITFAGSQIFFQVGQLQQVLVDQFNQLMAWGYAHGMPERQFDPEQALSYAAGSVGQVTAVLGSVIGGLTSVFMIVVLGLFFAIEPRLYERGVAWLLPTDQRKHFYDVSSAVGSTLRKLLAGRLLGMLVEGLATWILLALYGIPMAALLGIITGLFVFIPNIGAIASGVLMILVGFSTGWEGGMYALAVYFIVHTIDGYVIVPMVARRTVDLAPALVLGAQLLFGVLFGILGLALADPIVATIKVALEKNAARGVRKEQMKKEEEAAELADHLSATADAATPARERISRQVARIANRLARQQAEKGGDG